MNGVNKVILVGTVGRDPESRAMPDGTPVTSVALATSFGWKDKNTGQPQEKTEWHNVVFYQRLAEVVSQYVRKGSKIYVEGSLQTRMWEQDGQKRYKTEIRAIQLQLLDSKQDSGTQQQAHQPAAQPPAQQPSTPAAAPFYDDDIPFS